MVFSELLIKFPYILLRRLTKLFRKDIAICFYAAEELDYVIFKNVRKYFPKLKICVNDRKLRDILSSRYGEQSEIYPVFPDVLIMARHSHHKFPDREIIKIGLRHGPYHFKDFIAAEKYNRFDLFLLTSETELAQAKAIGIKTADCGGFPKCDSLFDESFISSANALKTKIFANDKPILLFTSTWNKSGLAGVHFWYDNLSELTDKYNILVTLHPWVDGSFREVIKSTSNVVYIDCADLTEYLLMSDVLIGDTSSIIAEYMLLDKPIITFDIPKYGRLSEEIIEMLNHTSFRISDFSELGDTIKFALNNPNIHSEKRKYYIDRMFAKNLGKHSELAARKIKDFISKRLGINNF